MVYDEKKNMNVKIEYSLKFTSLRKWFLKQVFFLIFLLYIKINLFLFYKIYNNKKINQNKMIILIPKTKNLLINKNFPLISTQIVYLILKI